MADTKDTKVKKSSTSGSFKKGHKKVGGRVKGTPNKRSSDVKKMINELYPDYDPICAMVEIGLNDRVDVDIRLNAHKEIAKYFYPQLKAVEHKLESEQLQSTREIFLQHLKDM